MPTTPCKAQLSMDHTSLHPTTWTEPTLRSPSREEIERREAQVPCGPKPTDQRGPRMVAMEHLDSDEKEGLRMSERASERVNNLAFYHDSTHLSTGNGIETKAARGSVYLHLD